VVSRRGAAVRARQLGALVGNQAMLITATVVLLLVFVFFAYRLVSYAEQSDQFRGKVVQFDLGLAALQSQIGYDGMIHDFKNCVLRPAEPRYCDEAQADAAAALASMDELERVSASIGTRIEFVTTREMVENYGERAGQVAQMHRQGLSLGEIDERVRFDDVPAVEEIRGIQGMAIEGAERISDDFRRDVLWQAIGSLVLVVMLLIAIAAIVRQRSRFEQAQMRADAADRLDLANQRLAEANGALQQFASVASHDLKAPVRHMALFADAIRQEAEGREPITGFTADITSAAHEMSGIIDSLLTFSKTGFRDVDCETIDTRSLLADAVAGMDVQLAETGAEVFLGEVPETIYGDRRLLMQVFRNLLSNSLKYISPGTVPEVQISGSTEDGVVRLTVTDNGIGIEPRFADEVFKPLRRLHGADSAYEGSGLGLSLVRTIARAHGGDAVIDVRYSGGTRVIVTLDEATLRSENAQAAD